MCPLTRIAVFISILLCNNVLLGKLAIFSTGSLGQSLQELNKKQYEPHIVHVQ